MSYDLTVSGDHQFSRSCDAESLERFISSLPRVEFNGQRSFVLCDGKKVWMEIDLEHVTEDGDYIEGSEGLPTVNCVRFHIPYRVLGSQPEHVYLLTVHKIAEYLGWTAIDDQTDEPLADAPGRPDVSQAKPWWKLW